MNAGWALILGKPSIYIVRSRGGLPFLLNNASQAMAGRQVRVFECPDTKSMVKDIAGYGENLFNYGDEAGEL